MTTVTLTTDAFIMGEPCTLRMEYDSAIPMEVLFSATYNGATHAAVFDREIIRRALSHGGYGDNQTIAMWTMSDMPTAVWVQMRNAHHTLTMLTSRNALAHFLYDTDTLVPNGAEHIEWDVVISKILGG